MGDKRYPVMEVFGPTIQGEGPDAGLPVKFVRFGGCDYRCSWCDSIHAVDPKLVKAGRTMMTAGEILEALQALGPGGDTLVLSGGNPALLDLGDLVDLMHQHDISVTVETQGTRWREWLRDVDLVVVSPKPPSSGMETDWTVLRQFIEQTDSTAPREGAVFPPDIALKIVVGDDADYRYAQQIHSAFPGYPMFVSVLNPAGSDEGSFDVTEILGRFRALCERVSTDPTMTNVKVLPQLHTLAWGAAKGV